MSFAPTVFYKKKEFLVEFGGPGGGRASGCFVTARRTRLLESRDDAGELEQG
jgi:hypothetical protein